MNKLVVFNTYKQSHSYQLNNPNNKLYAIASLEEGVGRIVKLNNEPFDLVLFVSGNPPVVNLDDYVLQVERFYKSLDSFKLVHSKTIYK